MPLLRLYLDDETIQRLIRIAAETGRGVEELAENAVSEAALHADRQYSGSERE